MGYLLLQDDGKLIMQDETGFLLLNELVVELLAMAWVRINRRFARRM